MSNQVRQAGKTIAEVYQVLRGTREGGYGCLLVGFTAEFVRCP